MCGIAGIIYTNAKSPQGEQAVGKMLKSMDHRGPDGYGITAVSDGYIGHKRLSIIDLSNNGKQPMQSANQQYTLTFNGELYNFKEVRAQLKNQVFSSDSDTEVLLKAYQEKGIDVLHQFNGMFAFGIWDEWNKELVLARDRVGIKPLYYALLDDKIIFSSELRAILQSGYLKCTISKSRIFEYLSYQTIHGPSTMVEEIKMLLPGHFLRWKGGKVQIQQYWDFPLDNPYKESKLAIQKSIRQQFTSSVERRLIADVSVGAFLSGGIDSTAVVGVCAKILDRKISTYNVSFDEEAFSERHYAASVAKLFCTDHHEMVLKPEDFLAEIPNALSAMDHPSGDGPNTYVVSKAVKENGITVALSGLGGDEVFAGYPVFNRALAFRKIKNALNLPYAIRKNMARLMAIFPGQSMAKMAQLLSIEDSGFNHFYFFNRRLFSKDQLGSMLGDFEKDIVYPNVGAEWSEGALMNQVGRSELKSYLVNTLLRDTDQMSMAHSLEVRVPFLDHQFLERCIALGDDVKIPQTPKQLFVESFKDILPHDISSRKKMGFVLPWQHWLHNELSGMVSSHLEGLSERGIFQKGSIEHMGQLYKKDKISWPYIWNLVVLESWLVKNNLDVQT